MIRHNAHGYIYSIKNSKRDGGNRGQNYYDPWPMTEKRERLLYTMIGYICTYANYYTYTYTCCFIQ